MSKPPTPTQLSFFPPDEEPNPAISAAPAKQKEVPPAKAVKPSQPAQLSELQIAPITSDYSPAGRRILSSLLRGFTRASGEFDSRTLKATAAQLLTAAGAPGLAKRLRIDWNPRLTTTAGLANYSKCEITLNPLLIPFGIKEVDRTLRHELAHLLARFRFGKKRIQPHGIEWRQACADLGLKDEQARHTLPLPRKAITPKHHYICNHCRAEVHRVRPFKRPAACLKCCRTHSDGRYDERFRFVSVSNH